MCQYFERLRETCLNSNQRESQRLNLFKIAQDLRQGNLDGLGIAKVRENCSTGFRLQSKFLYKYHMYIMQHHYLFL